MAMQTNLINVGTAPCLAMGMTYTAGAHSVGLLMENAVLNEKLAQVTANAGIDQCVALILTTGAAATAAGKQK